VSEGRGTTKPFEYTGAPFIDGHKLAKAMNHLELPGVRFREVNFVPMFSKHQGQLCSGVHLYVTDRNAFQPIEAALHLIKTIKLLFPDFAWREPKEGQPFFIDLLSGGTSVREWLERNGYVGDLIDSWKEGIGAFKQVRSKYLIYQ
jgi:beta-N-acetylhexosaminidase